MKDSMVSEKSLIPAVEVVDGRPMTTSIQVAEFFGKQHKNVLRDIEQILSQLPENSGKLKFEPAEYEVPAGGGIRKVPMYLMDKDAFTLLVMGYSGSEAMRFKLAYIQRFNEMEERIRGNMVALPNFTDPAAAARAWADQVERAREAEKVKAALEAQAKADRPKVLFAETVAISENTILIGELSKLITQSTGIKIGQNKMFVFLREKGYLHRHGAQSNLPTQRSIEAGWMCIREGTRTDAKGASKITKTTKITGKGQIYFVNLFKNRMMQATLPSIFPEDYIISVDSGREMSAVKTMRKSDQGIVARA